MQVVLGLGQGETTALMLVKDRSATKRRDRRKIVCAVSSAVYGNCHQKCAYCAYQQIYLGVSRRSKMGSHLNWGCASQDRNAHMIPRVFQVAPSFQGEHSNCTHGDA